MMAETSMDMREKRDSYIRMVSKSRIKPSFRSARLNHPSQTGGILEVRPNIVPRSQLPD